MAQATGTGTATANGWGRIATYGLLAMLLAIVVNGAVRMTAMAAFDVPSVFALGWGPVIQATATGAVGATLLYGVVTYASDRPDTTFTTVASILLLLTFLGPVSAFLSPPPEMADWPWTVFATLAVMHATGGAVIIEVLRGRAAPAVSTR